MRCENLDCIAKSSNSYTFEKEKLGVGRENAKKSLRENPKVLKKAMSEIMKASRSAE